MTIGEKLKNIRRENNLTQKQFADLIGIKQNTISDFEHDKIKPSIDTIELICDKMHIPVSYLINEKSFTESANTHGKILANLMRSYNDLEMMKKYYSLTEKDREIIRDLVNRM